MGVLGRVWGGPGSTLAWRLEVPTQAPTFPTLPHSCRPRARTICLCDVFQISLIFPAQVIDVPVAWDTKSIDYSRDVLTISTTSPLQGIDVPIAGDTKSVDYSRDVLQILMIFPSQAIDVPIAGDSKVLIIVGRLPNFNGFPVAGH